MAILFMLQHLIRKDHPRKLRKVEVRHVLP